MNATGIFLKTDTRKKEEKVKKVSNGKALKSILFIFILLSMVLLSSCFFPGPGHGGRSGMNERHNHHERHNRGGFNDHGEHIN